ncbi:hypothetical protein HDU76_003199 [Blyttiomyces sp. JEL0837]|nr:hypothetical protein HDU76_003199 [Blyttiomyces sp. JEL0837]
MCARITSAINGKFMNETKLNHGIFNKSISKPILILAYEVLQLTIDLASQSPPQEFDGYLTHAFDLNAVNANTKSVQIRLKSADKIRVIISLLCDGTVGYVKEAAILLKVLQTLYQSVRFRDGDEDDDDGRRGEMKEFSSKAEDMMKWLCEIWEREGLNEFSKAALKVCDSLGVYPLPLDEDEDEDASMTVLPESTVPSVINLLITSVNEGLDEIYWIISRMKLMYSVVTIFGNDFEDAFLKIENVICDYMVELVIVQYNLLRAKMTETAFEPLLKSLTRTFKGLTQYTQYKIKRSHDATPAYLKLLETVTKELRETINIVVPAMQQEAADEPAPKLKKDSKEKGKDKKVNSKKRKRSGRTLKSMPLVTFQIEQFERFLIALNKKISANLLKYVKRSTARDFKIDTKKLVFFESDQEDDSEDGDYGNRT